MIPGAGSTGEAERLRRVYAAYDADTRRRAVWHDTPSARFVKERQWEAITGLFGRFARIRPGSWVVDLGAGDRSDSARFTSIEPDLAGIVAIDILHERIAAAGRPGALLRPVVGDAMQLPLADGTAGLVYQATMLSSVLRSDLRCAAFAEVRRVLRPGGIFLSYDARFPNPWNPDTRRVRLAELRRAFVGWPQAGRSMTGIPQVLRVLAPLSLTLCRMVEAVPLLRVYRLFAAIKP